MSYKDFDEIIPRLWQGSAPPAGPYLKNDGFTILVLCAEGYQPEASSFPGLQVIHAPFLDSEDVGLETFNIAQDAAAQVAQLYFHGHKILTTCMAGLNRSSLVNAYALNEIKGWGGDACVEVIKQKRYPLARYWDPYYPEPLSNARFLEEALKLPKTWDSI